MAIELGTAYVSIVPSTKGLGKSLAKEMQGVTASAAATGQKAGSSLASNMGSALKTGTKVAGAGVAAVLGTALVKGFGRLSAIENAEAKLKGLGNSGADTAKIMENALASVKGTAFGMDEAATTAASAVAAGIKPGKDLTRYLGLVGDAATIGGTSMAEMGSIFNKVATSGKVQGDVFAQLGDKGIPVIQMLSETLGVAAEDVAEMGSKGQISSEDFLEAMSAMEGAALESGNTTTGAFKNMNAALGRLGAGLLKGVYPAIGPVFNALTAGLDKAEEFLTPLAEGLSIKVGGALERAGKAVVQFVTPLKDIGNLEVLTPEIVKKMGLSPDSPLGKGMHELIGGVRAFTAAWKYNDGEVTSSGFPGFMERAAYAIRQTWDALRAIDFSSWEAFKLSLGSSGGQIAAAFSSIGDSLVVLRPAMSEFLKSLPQIGGAVGTLAVAGISALASTLSFMARHVDTIIMLMPAIVAGFVAWRVASMALTASSQKLQWAQVAMAPVLLANNVLRLTNIHLENQQTKARLALTGATGAETTATVANNTAQSTGVFARTRAVAATVAHRVAMVASAVAAKTAAAGQWLLNAALTANPIGLVVVALVGLVAGLVVAYNKIGWFKDFVNAAWAAIKVGAAALVNWFTNVVVPRFKAALSVIGSVFKWLNTNVIQPVWAGIQQKISAVVRWFSGTVVPLFRVAASTIGAVFKRLLDGFVRPVWNTVRSVINVVGTWFRNTLVPLFRGGVQALQDKFSAFRAALGVVWDRIRSAASAAWDHIGGRVFDPMKRGLDRLKDGFVKTKDGISSAWEKLREAVRKPIAFVVNKVVNPFLSGYNKINNAWSGDDIGLIPGFRKGGYTGRKGRDEVAGVVHGDEHVIRSESRKTIEKASPGLLDKLNKHGASALPSFGHEGHAAHGGMAAGGPGGPGTYLWGGLQNAIYSSGVAHVRGSAPGFNIPAAARAWNNMSNLKVRYGSGPNQIEVGGGAPAGTWGYAWSNGQIRLNPGIPAGMKTGTAAHEIGHVLGLDHAGTNSIMHPMMRGPLWPSAYDRATIQRIYGGSGRGNPPEGGGGGGFDIFGAIKKVLSGPLGKLKELLSGGNAFTQMAGGLAKNVVNGIMEKASGGRIDDIWDAPVGTTHRLPKGASTIYNGTGGNEFFQRVDPSKSGGGLNIHGNVYTVDENEFANRVFKKAAQREALYAA